MKVLQKHLSEHKTSIIELKKKQGNIISNRDEILRVGEELYKSRLKNTQTQTQYPKQGVINQGFKQLPDIKTEQIRDALSKL